jgi:hypothetical protein
VTNHEAATELIAIAQQNGGLQVGTDWVPLDAAQSAFNSFIAHVPERELEAPMTFGGREVKRPAVHRSWCEKAEPNPPRGFRSRICSCGAEDKP